MHAESDYNPQLKCHRGSCSMSAFPAALTHQQYCVVLEFTVYQLLKLQVRLYGDKYTIINSPVALNKKVG